MRPILILSLIAVFLASATEAGRVSCYFGSWAKYREGVANYTVEDIPGDLCTHVIYSFIGLNPQNWEVKILDQSADIDEGGFSRFVGLKKKYPGLKTIVSIGGWGEGGENYSNMVSKPSRRSSFINSAIGFLNKYKFDGLDFDWEFPGAVDRGGKPEDKANFATFIKELRQAFDQEGNGWEVSIAVNVGEYIMNDGYDVASLCQNVHVVNAMTYDLRGTWDTFVDVHSPLYSRSIDEGAYKTLNVNDGLQRWVDHGCPANKLIVGIPFYGVSFTTDENNHKLHAPSRGPGAGGPYMNEPGNLAYYEICDSINNRGWTEKFDDEGKVPYAYKGKNWVGYEDPNSVQIKMDFIRQKGYGGAMTWAIDMDDFKGLCGPKNPLATILRNNS